MFRLSELQSQIDTVRTLLVDAARRVNETKVMNANDLTQLNILETQLTGLETEASALSAKFTADGRQRLADRLEAIQRDTTLGEMSDEVDTAIRSRIAAITMDTEARSVPWGADGPGVLFKSNQHVIDRILAGAAPASVYAPMEPVVSTESAPVRAPSHTVLRDPAANVPTTLPRVVPREEVGVDLSPPKRKLKGPQRKQEDAIAL
jgi:hypothetical protein